MKAVLQTAVLSNATAAELHCLLACTSLSFAALTPNTHLWWNQRDARSRPTECKSVALLTELWPHKKNQFHSPELFASKHLDD